MPPKVLIVTVILCLVAGGLGLWLGMLDAHKSETDIINAAAALWSAETGVTDVTSCLAWAGSDGMVWLEVRCGMNETKRTYRFDHDGRLIRQMAPEA